MTMKELRGQLLLHGRVLWSEDGAMGLSWSFSGFSLCFEGDALTLTCAPYPTEEYLAVCVDGVVYKTAVREHFSLSVKQGLHTVTLRRASAQSDAQTVFITGLTVNGAFTAPPAAEKRRLEFIGDSITCGYGILGVPGAGYETRTEDATVNYAAQVARALDAEARFLAISGQGVAHDCSGAKGRLLSEFFEYNTRLPQEGSFAFDDGWQPDAVVINAGTNDVGGKTTDAEMTAGATAFIRQVRARYPHAAIVWTYGLMNGEFIPALEAAVQAVRETDKNVRFVPLERIGAGEVGANGHPGLLGHRRAAKILTAALEECLHTRG